MPIEIRSGVPAGAQETSFMNATLQSAGTELAFSVAVHVEVPLAAQTSEQALADHLRELFASLAADPTISIEIEIGPEDA